MNNINITFSSPYDHDDFDDDDDVHTCPYINISDPDENIKNQEFPDEIVIPMKEIRIEYSYPLDDPVVFTYNSDANTGFTRSELARKICEGYQRIYKEEDEAVGPTGNVSSIMLNRAQSAGPYGIWGHHISDLALHSVYQIENDLFGLVVDS